MGVDGYVQLAPDSTGKYVGNFAVKLPAGTNVTAGDGSITTLTADTVVYLQRTVISDPSNHDEAAAVENGRLQVAIENSTVCLLAAVLEELRAIKQGMETLVCQPLYGKE